MTSILLTTTLVFVVMVLSSSSDACFPVKEIFSASIQWMKPISVASRHLFSFGYDERDAATLLVKNEGGHILVSNSTI